MALKATIFKANLQVNDLDRHYYTLHALTMAQHPSETDERLMVRLLAFALHADEALEFGKGLSSDEPTLWQKDATGLIDLIIEIGLPDEQLLRRYCGRAKQVVVYAYGGRTVPQIFIGDTHVGGCDDLVALDQRGGLLPLLQAQAA